MILHRHYISHGINGSITFDGVGYCIYCKTAPNGEPLTDEHIIPDGLRGNLILRDASCKNCAKAINYFESRTINHNFGSVREFLKIRSGKRRGKRRTPFETSYQAYTHEGSQKSARYPINDSSFSVLSFEITGLRAGILCDRPSTEKLPLALHLAGGNPDSFPRNSSVQNLVFVGGYTKMAAKIAHSYAYAILRDRFTEYLDLFILDDEDFSARSYHIGVAPKELTREGYLHSLTIRTEKVDVTPLPGLGTRPKNFVIVEMRLFANFGTHTTEIVVGEMPVE